MPQSKSDTHLTPDEVYDKIDELGWSKDSRCMFDPCPPNADFNGLTIPWQKENYINPPYGDGSKDEDGNTLLARFVYKALREYILGHYSVMLLPSKTDQEWFHSLEKEGFLTPKKLYWFDHRLKFKNNKWSATQPHFLVRIAP